LNPIKTVLDKSLYNYLKEKQPLAIAFSGGMDSSALILFCHDNQIRYTGFSLIGLHITDYEIQRIIILRKKYGLNHCFFYFDYRSDPRVVLNSRRRCFHCKSLLFSGPARYYARTHTLIDGTNSTDLVGYRPGIEAIKAHGIKSPFADLGMDKDQIISLARQLGLKADRIDSRSCILARFSYGEYLDDLLVARIRKAEDYLLEKGLNGFRLRVLGCSDYLLQMDTSQESLFFHIKPCFDEFIKGSGLYSYRIQIIPFSEMSGYYD